MYHYFCCYKKIVADIAFILLLTVSFSASSYAATKPNSVGTSQYRVAAGYIIYLGILPAEMMLGQVQMHGGMPTGAFRYHVTVAVFDSETGKRIINTNVSARLSNSSSDTGFKKLENMAFNTMRVYGNYFKSSSPGPYRIQILVENKKRAEKVMVEFQYLQAHVQLEN